jgi:hypothetical protein
MLDNLKSAIRPVVTVSLVWGVLGMIYLKIPVPDWMITLTTMAVSFWFASRKESEKNGNQRQD